MSRLLFSTLQLAQILPTEENFLLCFREFVGSSSEFMTVSACLCCLSRSITLSSSNFCDDEDLACTRPPVGCSLTNRSTSLSREIFPRMPEVSSDISGSPLGHTLICSVIVCPSRRDAFLGGSHPITWKLLSLDPQFIKYLLKQLFLPIQWHSSN